MAGVKFAKDSKEFKIMGEVWRILSEFYDPEDSLDYWNTVQAVLNEFVRKWDRDPLATHMAEAVILYLDEKMHKRKGEFGGGNDGV